MPLLKVAPGENVNEVVSFTDINDEPVIDIETVRFMVIVDDNVVVNSTNATPDPSDPSTYTINFTLPAGTPFSLGDDLAKLVVFGIDSFGTKYKHTQYFTVANVGDETLDSDEQNYVVGTVDTGFTVKFVLPGDLNPATVSFTLYNDSGAPASIIPNGALTVNNTGGKKVYSYSYPDNHGFTPSASVLGGFVGKWVAKGGNLSDTIVHSVTVYILNNTAISLIDSVLSLIDKANIQHIHKYLSWDTATIVPHLFKGFDRVNGTGPIITNFSVNNPLPIGLTHYIVKAAALSALQAQYQAENASNFDFQGLGVQLNVDRLPGLSELISQLQADLDKLPDDKKTWNQNGQPTGTTQNAITSYGPIAIGITLSEATNYMRQGHWDEGLMWDSPRRMAGTYRIGRRRS